jgi:hypothetical protein
MIRKRGGDLPILQSRFFKALWPFAAGEKIALFPKAQVFANLGRFALVSSIK